MTGEFDFILLFVKNRQELERLFQKAKQVLRYDGIPIFPVMSCGNFL